MSESTDDSTWRQAVLLWFWTNVGGFTGVFLSLASFAALDSHHRSSGEMGIVALIGLIAALPSLPIIPVAYIIFRSLLRIPTYWPRLLTTAAVITAFFLLIVAAAAMAILGSKFSLLEIMRMGGWAYWLSALAAAALLYEHRLFRPDTAQPSPGEATNSAS